MRGSLAILSLLLFKANPCCSTSLHTGIETNRTWMVDPSEDPATRAKKLLEKMSITEKLVMLHGTGVSLPYTGNIVGNERLGIPPLKLNDGPQGFRDTENGNVGTSTAFPSGMTVGMTWDIKLAFAWGAAMGKEFHDKGASVMLGPGLCVARVPKNGRNFEYISGEDPYLGMIMSEPVIAGIQNENVIANAKHWVNNNQETDRFTIDEEVDERTRFEMYYPPFEGAIAADVGSMMCSYNKVNGKWSCENPKTLARDLKERLGFKGWVMSDWDATHSASINEGLDMEMPGFDFMGTELTQLVANGTIKESTIDESVVRILTPMFQQGLFDNLSNGTIKTNVTSEAHNHLSRQLAGAATVLLKNDGNLLPLDSSISSVAVIGPEAIQPTVHGGGSGAVVSYYTSSPLDAIRAAMGLPKAPPKSNCSDGDFLKGITFGESEPQTQTAAESVNDCCELCAANFFCRAFSFDGSQCYMKSIGQDATVNASVVSGTCRPAAPEQECTEDGSRCVYFATNPEEAAVAAAKADVAIVFLATTSSEGVDRDSLGFGDGQDALVDAAASANHHVVVCVVAPGAVLMPWSHNENVSAILYAGLPGQEYGNAIVDILTGSVNPSSRLTFSMPNVENEQNFTKEQWPGVDGKAIYSEKLLFGYRYYDAHGITPRFAFGHGLSFTEFTYSDISLISSLDGPTKVEVRFKLTNSGTRDGEEVAQMYVQFPDVAGEPPMQLKGFSKVQLTRGESKLVGFKTNDRTFSVWDADAHGWDVVSGKYNIFVGSSSRDIRLTTTVTIP